MKLVLIRHGSTIENETGILIGQNPGNLSSAGIGSVKRATKKLEHTLIHSIYSSDLKRCVDTSTILNRGIKVPVFLDKRLREINFGDFQGMPYDVITQDYSGNPDLHFPNGESNNEMSKRVMQFLEEVEARHTQDTLLIVSHSGPIAVILSQHYKIPLNKALELHTKNAELTEIEM